MGGALPSQVRRKSHYQGSLGFISLPSMFGYHFNRTKASVGGSHVKLTLTHFRRDWRVTKVAPGDATSHSGLCVLLSKRGLHLIRGLNRSVKL